MVLKTSHTGKDLKDYICLQLVEELKDTESSTPGKYSKITLLTVASPGRETNTRVPYLIQYKWGNTQLALDLPLSSTLDQDYLIPYPNI